MEHNFAEMDVTVTVQGVTYTFGLDYTVGDIPDPVIDLIGTRLRRALAQVNGQYGKAV